MCVAGAVPQVIFAAPPQVAGQDATLVAADLAKVVKVQSLAAVNNLTIMSVYFVFVDTGPGRVDETTVLSDAARNNVTGLQLGGGGAGLPNCSLVSPVSSRQPGTNCIAG